MKKQKTLETYEEVKEKALNLLEFRSHSEKELTDKLKRNGAAAEHIEDVLEFCRRYGFVNDEAYAVSKSRDLMNLKKFGLRRIKQELRAKGISEENIEIALSELDTDKSNEILEELVRKKLNGDFTPKNTARCIRYFVYRGYDLSDIRDCISILENEI